MLQTCVMKSASASSLFPSCHQCEYFSSDGLNCKPPRNRRASSDQGPAEHSHVWVSTLRYEEPDDKLRHKTVRLDDFKYSGRLLKNSSSTAMWKHTVHSKYSNVWTLMEFIIYDIQDEYVKCIMLHLVVFIQTACSHLNLSQWIMFYKLVFNI